MKKHDKIFPTEVVSVINTQEKDGEKWKRLNISRTNTNEYNRDKRSTYLLILTAFCVSMGRNFFIKITSLHKSGRNIQFHWLSLGKYQHISKDLVVSNCDALTGFGTKEQCSSALNLNSVEKSMRSEIRNV